MSFLTHISLSLREREFFKLSPWKNAIILVEIVISPLNSNRRTPSLVGPSSLGTCVPFRVNTRHGPIRIDWSYFRSCRGLRFVQVLLCRSTKTARQWLLYGIWDPDECGHTREPPVVKGNGGASKKTPLYRISWLAKQCLQVPYSESHTPRTDFTKSVFFRVENIPCY